jgi:hypothetical protein
MGVDVDDAGHQREPAGVDDLVGTAADLADGGDPRIADRDVGAARVAPEPVDNRGTTDEQIVHPGPPPAMSGARR